jgi:hypothetical protein
MRLMVHTKARLEKRLNTRDWTYILNTSPSPLPPNSSSGELTASKLAGRFLRLSGLPGYVTKVLKDLVWVLTIRATHTPCLLELLHLLQSYTHCIAHKLRAGPENRQALFVALDTIPGERGREKKDTPTATGIWNQAF